jgi:hypothetical protein
VLVAYGVDRRPPPCAALFVRWSVLWREADMDREASASAELPPLDADDGDRQNRRYGI